MNKRISAKNKHVFSSRNVLFLPDANAEMPKMTLSVIDDITDSKL